MTGGHMKVEKNPFDGRRKRRGSAGEQSAFVLKN